MEGKILLLNYDARSKRKLDQALAKAGEEIKTRPVARVSEAENERPKCVFFLHRKGGDISKTLEQLREEHKTIPVCVVFKRKDFDSLMEVRELPLAGILTDDYETSALLEVLGNCEGKIIKTPPSQTLPQKALLELLSSSIKVKTERDLHRRLYAYFSHFAEKPKLGLYKAQNGGFELAAGSDIADGEALKKAGELKLPKLFVGKKFGFEREGDEALRGFPVYEHGGVYTWCFCLLPKDETKEAEERVLNDFFFRYLENVLVFRKNLERVQAYLDLSNKDEVTGLYNQRKLVKDLAETIEAHREAEETFSIMFIDVDHFKKVNDNYGHVVGSQMLVEIGKELSDTLRSSDKIYRYGGDEFVVMMPKVNIETVHKISVRVIEKMKQKTFNVGKAKNYQLSLSIGIAEYPTDAKTADEIISFADSMMYVSKKSGRGKVFHVGEVEDDIVGVK